MEHKKLIWGGLLNALGITIYIALVTTVMRHGDRIFGPMKNFWGPIVFLLLFVLSAAITGSLALGRPILLYLDGQKQAGVRLFLYTLGWLAVFVVGILIFSIK